ncbi:MAG: 16S rRNA (guanine(527)-N(7))-methyltransferase RsmG [Candidatus Paceibacterota bacterium]|jgi:16S rRNA (guanine527-N7)-methyltransferase
MDDFLAYTATKNIDLGPKRLEHFKTYLTVLLEWNEKMNLTGIKDPEDIWRKHFLDSLTVLEAIPASTRRVIDIGTGAGFPGLPLAIVRPDLEVVLLEATGKKVKFLEHVILTLGLKNVTAIHGRAELVSKEKMHRERFDVVLARAVAMLPVIAGYALPFLKKGGVLIAQKKLSTDEKLASEEEVVKLGGSMKEAIALNIPALPDRELVVVEKL